MSRIVCLLVVAGAVTGCKQAPREATVAAVAPPAARPLVRPATQPSSSPLAGPRSAGPRFGGEPAAPTLPPACRTLVEDFKKVAVAATSRCAKDDDCACYALPWLELAGRVAEKATVDRIGEIRSNYLREGCPRVDITYRKAPSPCVPKCVAGRCTSARPGG